MLDKTDCLNLLIKLEDTGIDVNGQIKKLLVEPTIPLDVLKFIASHQGIEISNFYEMLRKKHNQKKSPLYKNLLQGQNTEEDIITTLSCLLVQIILYGNKLTDGKEIFFKEVRAEEISKVINGYFKTGSLDDCIKLLKLIKTDLLVLEGIAGKREFQ